MGFIILFRRIWVLLPILLAVLLAAAEPEHASEDRSNVAARIATTGQERVLEDLSQMSSKVAAQGPEHITPVGVAISVMLLGSIAFMMSLFYLVNHPDDDMKRYSWQVISSTISIFCAVLFFQGCNGVVQEFVVKGGSHEWKLIMGLVQVVVWFVGLQLVLAIASGSLGKRPNSLDEVELNMKSWATLFAHTCGFACINAFGVGQQLPWFSRSPATLMVIVPIGALGLFCFYVMFDWIRWHVANADDGEVDEYEDAWDKHAEEAENDVMGLSCSFVTVQAFRFAISGVLPNPEGAESSTTEYAHPSWQVTMLVGIGIGLGCVTILCLFISRLLHGQHEYIHRIACIMEVFASTGFAWCFFFATGWGMHHLEFTQEEALLRVAMALLLSFLSFCVIFLLDTIADMDTTGDAAEEAIRTVVEALGILVGFSWEQSFDTATDNVVNGLLYKLDPAVAKLILSILLVALVFPAWRNFILPTVLRLEKEHHAETGHGHGHGHGHAHEHGHGHGHEHVGEADRHLDHALHKNAITKGEEDNDLQLCSKEQVEKVESLLRAHGEMKIIEAYTAEAAADAVEKVESIFKTKAAQLSRSPGQKDKIALAQLCTDEVIARAVTSQKKISPKVVDEFSATTGRVVRQSSGKNVQNVFKKDTQSLPEGTNGIAQHSYVGHQSRSEPSEQHGQKNFLAKLQTEPSNEFSHELQVPLISRVQSHPGPLNPRGPTRTTDRHNRYTLGSARIEERSHKSSMGYKREFSGSPRSLRSSLQGQPQHAGTESLPRFPGSPRMQSSSSSRRLPSNSSSSTPTVPTPKLSPGPMASRPPFSGAPGVTAVPGSRGLSKQSKPMNRQDLFHFAISNPEECKDALV